MFKLKKILYPALFAIAISISLPAYSLDITKPVTDGVTLTQSVSDNPSYPLFTNVLTADFNTPDLEFRPVLGRDAVYTSDKYKGKENVGAMVERTGAIAGVNADFFPMEWGGDPLGICIINGELVSEPCGNRAAVAFTKDRKVFFDIPTCNGSLACADGTVVKLDGINKPRGTGQLVAYTQSFGSKVESKFAVTYVRCSTPDLPVTANKPVNLTVTEIMPDVLNAETQPGTVLLAGGGESAKFLKEKIKVGDALVIRFDISGSAGCDWSTVQQAVGGGPWLVKDGVEAVDLTAEGFGADIGRTNPRTAIGVTKDNKVLMVTVDGRQDISKGMTIDELASLMRRLGAQYAINLDGGGSTSLAIRGVLINSPSGGTERYVANALLLFSNKPVTAVQDKIEISGIPDSITAGDFAHMTLTQGPDNKPVEDNSLIIWGSKSGTGLVDQMGRFAPTKAHKGTVCAVYGSSIVKKNVLVTAAAADKITAKLSPDPIEPSRSNLNLTCVDKFGNPVTERTVSLDVKGGTADQGTMITDSEGKFTSGITWSTDSAERTVVVKIDKTSVSVKPAVVAAR